MTANPYGRHLPIFPMLSGLEPEGELENIAERLMDRADAALIAGKATTGEYARWTVALDAWVKRQIYA
jgi:hypothetical protein